MAQRETENIPRRDRMFESVLWIPAALLVVLGFILRSLSTVLGHPGLRLTGIVVIGIAILFAVMSWISDRISAARRTE
jgi:type IV secretory pathway VirB2 component (pilin)